MVHVLELVNLLSLASGNTSAHDLKLACVYDSPRLQQFSESGVIPPLLVGIQEAILPNVSVPQLSKAKETRNMKAINLEYKFSKYKKKCGNNLPD